MEDAILQIFSFFWPVALLVLHLNYGRYLPCFIPALVYKELYLTADFSSIKFRQEGFTTDHEYSHNVLGRILMFTNFPIIQRLEAVIMGCIPIDQSQRLEAVIGGGIPIYQRQTVLKEAFGHPCPVSGQPSDSYILYQTLCMSLLVYKCLFISLYLRYYEHPDCSFGLLSVATQILYDWGDSRLLPLLS